MPDKLINETDTVVVLPAHVVLGEYKIITPTGLVALEDITSEIINRYAVVDSLGHPNAGGGGNISCAIDAGGFTLGYTDSKEEDDKTLCDPGNAKDLGEKQFEGDLTAFREKNRNDRTSVFQLFESLFFVPDVSYVIVHREGFASDVPFAAGQEIDAFAFDTDFPLPIHADGAKQKIQTVLIPKNESLDSFILPA